jgi:hypothetical protein
MWAVGLGQAYDDDHKRRIRRSRSAATRLTSRGTC